MKGDEEGAKGYTDAVIALAPLPSGQLASADFVDCKHSFIQSLLKPDSMEEEIAKQLSSHVNDPESMVLMGRLLFLVDVVSADLREAVSKLAHTQAPQLTGKIIPQAKLGFLDKALDLVDHRPARARVDHVPAQPKVLQRFEDDDQQQIGRCAKTLGVFAYQAADLMTVSACWTRKSSWP